MTLIGGLPAHPLIVHAVVVLLPLAAVGALAVAARPVWRRGLGVPVFLIALAGVAAVPIAQRTGYELEQVIAPGNQMVATHEQRAATLLPFALLFLALLLATLLLGRHSDRAEDRAGGTGTMQTRVQARLTSACAVLAALAGLVVAGLVMWIGEAGATAVWQRVVAR